MPSSGLPEHQAHTHAKQKNKNKRPRREESGAIVVDRRLEYHKAEMSWDDFSFCLKAATQGADTLAPQSAGRGQLAFYE